MPITTTENGGYRLDYSHLRATTGKVTITPEAISFVASLPSELRPVRLLTDFPHVLNRIASLLKQPRRLDNYFVELLMDSRGGRQGFPLLAALEIASLREHYQSAVAPIKATVWDSLYRLDKA